MDFRLRMIASRSLPEIGSDPLLLFDYEKIDAVFHDMIR